MFTINNDVYLKEVDSGAVLLHLDSGEYFSINPLGLFIWQQITEQKSEAEILSAILDAYAVSEESAQQDLKEFLEALKEKDIIQPAA